MSVVRSPRRWRQISLEESGRSYGIWKHRAFPLALLSSGGPMLGSGAPQLLPESAEIALPEMGWREAEELIDELTAHPQASALPELHWATVDEVLGNPTINPQEIPLPPLDSPTLYEPPGRPKGHKLVKRGLDNIIGETQSASEKSFWPGETARKRLCVRDSIDRAGPSWADFVKPDGVGSFTDEKTEGLSRDPMGPIRSEPSKPSTSRAEDDGVSSAYLASVDDLGVTESGPTNPIFDQFKTPPSDEEMLLHGLPLLLGFSLDRKMVAELIGAHRSIADLFASKSAVDIRELRQKYKWVAKTLVGEGDGGLALMRILHWILRTWGTSPERQEICRLLNQTMGRHLRLTVVDSETDLIRPTGSKDGRGSLPFRLEAGGKEIDLTNIPWRVQTDRGYTKLTLIAVEGKRVLFLTVPFRELLKKESLRGCQNELFSEIEAAHPLIVLAGRSVLARGFTFIDPPPATSNAASDDRKSIFNEILQRCSFLSERATQCLPFNVIIHSKGNLTAIFSGKSAPRKRVHSSGPIASWKKENFVDVDELNVDEPKYAFFRDNFGIQYTKCRNRAGSQFIGDLFSVRSVSDTPTKTSVRFVDANCPPRFVERIEELGSWATVYEPNSGSWVIGFRQPGQILKTTKLADSKEELLRVPSNWQTQKRSAPIHSIPLKTFEDKAIYSKAKAMEEFLPKLTGLPFTEILRTLKNGELREIAAIHWPFDLSDQTDYAPVDTVADVESISNFESFLAFRVAVEELHYLWSASQPPITWNTEVYGCIDSCCNKSLSLSLDSNGSKVLEMNGRQYATNSMPIAMRMSNGYLHGILAFKNVASDLLLHLKSGPFITPLCESHWAETEAFKLRPKGHANKASWRDAPVGLSILTSEGVYTLQGDRWEKCTSGVPRASTIDEENPSTLCATSDSAV